VDIDLLAAIATAANFNYEFVQTPWLDLFDQVKNNQVDFAISGITINDVRKETYDFSVPYFLSTHKILAKEGTDITSAKDLVNKKVAVIEGTTGASAVEKILGADNPNILKFVENSQGVQAVIDGQADAYVNDNSLVEYFANNNPGFAVIEDSEAFAKEFYGLMFPKGSDLRDLINEAITTVLENGEYAAIHEKWLGSTPDVDLLLEAGTYENPYDVFDENAEELNHEDEETNAEGEVDWNDNFVDIDVDVDVDA
jgi:polar amino acid transport system substrate-binding protein